MTFHKLNMGSGLKHFPAYTSVDKHPFEGVSIVHDLETFPWPWEDSSVSDMIWFHSLEHCGASADTFLGMMSEMYRVCADNATIHICVPHVRHTDFIGDPTHVRSILPETIAMFSKANNDHVLAANGSNTRFAHLLSVDFEVTHTQYALDPDFEYLKNDPTWEKYAKTWNNVIKEVRLTVKVRKPGAPRVETPEAEANG